MLATLFAPINHKRCGRTGRRPRSAGHTGAAARDAIPVLQALLDDPNAKVREEAAHALKEIRSGDKEP